MLELCKKQAAQHYLTPVLYCQSLEQLALPELYMTLYIPSCSFMLIQDAQHAFEQWYKHIAPGGQLLISLFVPWYERDNQEGVFTLQGDITSMEKRILLYQALSYRPIEQLRQGIHRFEVYDAALLERVELYELWWRWYGSKEFEMLLKQAGFKEIAVYGDYTLQGPATDAQTLIFRARKI
jgi:hypothetical protein